MYAQRDPVSGQFYVNETSEIVRVRNLPARDWQKSPDTTELIARLTTWLQHTPRKCTPRCTCCQYVSALNAAQAHFLTELFANRGRSVAPFRTGGGKTLASLLAATVLEKALGRPLKAVLVVPASGRPKTELEAGDYARHWRAHPFTLVSYETLSHPNHAQWLEAAQPDVLLLDETHKVKNPRSKAWGRIRKYLATREIAGSTVYLVPFTASYVGRSIMESWHYTRAAMRDRAPVPVSEDEAKVWASTMDEKVDELARLLPGAISTLGPRPDGDLTRVDRARKVYGTRLVSTPGIVATMDGVPPVTLKLSAHALPTAAAVEQAVTFLRKHKVLPNGDSFESAMRVWAVARQLGLGMYYRFDPPPPRAWVEARKAWHTFALAHSTSRSKWGDSTVHVANAVDRGALDDGGALAHWRSVKDLYEYKTVDEWIDTAALGYAAGWLAEHPKGLCWVEQRAFGTELARRTGLPYFSEGARDERGRLINTYKGGAAIVSTAQREQHNLQFFDSNLITSCPPTGQQLDQLIGRTVRDGQGAEEVTVEFLLTVRESYTSLAQCFADSRASQLLEGGQPKKLCYGECTDNLVRSIKDGEYDYASP